MNTVKDVTSELKAVAEIVDALDVTAHESAGPDTCSCIRHGLEFLEDHLRRLYGMEESSGLLDIIIGIHPELAREVHRLQAEHDAIRAEAHRLVLALENPSAPSDESLQAIVQELRKLIAGILNHERHERAVLIESTNSEQGGEG
jgi:hypothetical protein